MEENREIEIDLRKIFGMLKRKVVFIILIGLIGAAVSGCYTNFLIAPKYTARITLCAYSDSDRVTTDSSISQSEISASQQLVNSYIEILKSEAVLDKVSEQLGGVVSASQIKSMLSSSQVEDTFIFKIGITSTSAQQAADIANAIADVAPDELVQIINAGSVKVVDYATVPTSSSSPNLQKNVLIGFAIFFALSFAYFFIREIFDTSIMNEQDLEKEFDIPVLGTIPRLVPSDEEGESSTSSSKTKKGKKSKKGDK